MLMLAVQTMQAILKDVKMREQAHLIQREVTRLMEDMGRLRERVLDLQRHFGQANQDIEKILTSSERIAGRGSKIESLEFEADQANGAERDRGTPLAATSRKVDEERQRATVTRQQDLLAGNLLPGE
jgi:DNA recombination protein RmuC